MKPCSAYRIMMTRVTRVNVLVMEEQVAEDWGTILCHSKITE